MGTQDVLILSFEVYDKLYWQLKLQRSMEQKVMYQGNTTKRDSSQQCDHVNKQRLSYCSQFCIKTYLDI